LLEGERKALYVFILIELIGILGMLVYLCEQGG